MRLLLALLGVLLVAGCGASVAPATDVAPVSAPAETVAPVADPVSVAIPRLGIADDIVSVGLEPDGELEVPDVHQVGWFAQSPRPGAPGPSLLAGHVNWRGVAGSFARIGELRRGDEVIVTSKDGGVHRFEVSAVEQFAKADYDAHMPALLANTVGPELRLVTCSGDLVGHSYLSNTVVSARAA